MSFGLNFSMFLRIVKRVALVCTMVMRPQSLTIIKSESLGDVVVAVNGVSVVQFSHTQLVHLMAAQLTARLVLLSDNVAKVRPFTAALREIELPSFR